MDLRGGHRRTPLIEEPRRPPWIGIAILILVGTVVAWAASNADIDVRRLIPKPGSRVETRTVEVVEPVAPPVASEGARAEGGAGPRWAVPPSPDYPERGLAAGHALVRLGCFVEPDFSLNPCVVLQETPPDHGFGASALAAAREARVTRDSPVGARVDFSIRYAPPDE